MELASEDFIDPSLSDEETKSGVPEAGLPSTPPSHMIEAALASVPNEFSTLADPAPEPPFAAEEFVQHSSPPKPPVNKRADKRNNPLGKNQFAPKMYASDEVLSERLTAWEKDGKTVGAQMELLKVEFDLVVGRTTFKKLRERLAIVTKSEVRKLPSETVKSAVLEVAARGLGVVAIHNVLMKSELPVSHGMIRSILKNADPSGLATAVAPAKRIAQRRKEIKAASTASLSGIINGLGGAGPSSRSASPIRRRERARSGSIDAEGEPDEGYGDGSEAGGSECYQGMGTGGSSASGHYESRILHASESHERTRTSDNEHDPVAEEGKAAVSDQQAAYGAPDRALTPSEDEHVSAEQAAWTLLMGFPEATHGIADEPDRESTMRETRSAGNESQNVDLAIMDTA